MSWLTASPESSVNFTPLHELDGIITPSGLCFERHHGGIAEIDPADHRLMINGLVDKPLVFTMDDIKRMPRVNKVYFLECAANSGMEWRGAQLNGCQFTHGMIHNVMYTGVPLKTLLDEAGLKPNAKWLMLEGADSAGMNRSLPIEKALDDVLIAFAMNGEALRPEQGYPLRAVIPGWEGNLWVKWLRRIEVGDQPWQTREETSKYTDLLADGRSRKHTFIMDAKSVVTNPSPQAPLKHKGRNVLSGVAWSGRGTIKRVDVSLDGGRNWQTARIDGPVLDKSMVRFYVDFDWNGQELMIQSRAMDFDRLRAADQGRAAQGARRQLDLPQQRHPDLAGALRRGDRECRDRLSCLRIARAVCRASALSSTSPAQQVAARKQRRAKLGLGRPALAGGNQGLGYRRPAGRQGPSGRQGHGEAGRRDLSGAMRGLPWRVRPRRRPLAGARGRRGHAEGRPAGQDHRLVLARPLDGLRLHQARDAVRQRAVAVATTRSMR